MTSTTVETATSDTQARQLEGAAPAAPLAASAAVASERAETETQAEMPARVIVRKCPDLLSRFRGSMLGSLVGDCLGSPFEGEERPIAKSVINPYFEKLNEPTQSRKVVYKAYTDDTAMTHCLARSLIERKQFDAGDAAKRFVSEYYAQPKRGYGGNIIDVFKALKNDDCRDPYGPARLQFAGRGSYGNGAAMRVAPVALFCHHSVEEAINLAYKSSLITHTNELGYNGAILQCLAVHKALRLDPSQALDVDAFAEELEVKMGQIERYDSATGAASGLPGVASTPSVTSLLHKLAGPPPPPPHHSAAPVGGVDNGANDYASRRLWTPNLVKSSYRRKLEHVRLLLKRQPAPSADRVIDVLGHFVTAYGSVPTAIYSFLRSVKDLQDEAGADAAASGGGGLARESAFQRAVRTAISLGGDTDTIASMTGAIAGAFYGDREVAPALLNHCEGVQQALHLADALYEAVEH